MNIEIKSIFGDVLFCGDFSSVADTVKAAVAKRAYLGGADLRGADLGGAYLRCADLSGADLRCADLRCADLRCAYLGGADLRCADLGGADLGGADLRCADLSGATGADLAIASTRILPDGNIIGWKKCREGRIVRLLVPTDAKRSHAFGRKCRAEFVRVLDVFNKDGSAANVAVSDKDENTKYAKGATVRCDKWCDDYTQECAGGIHFFITRIEAENYCL